MMRSKNITLARRFVHRSRCLWWHAVLLACAAPFILPASYAGDLVINEFMADNATTVSDPQGDEDDWIELYNSGITDIDVAGMYLTDNLGNPTQHLIDTNSLIIGPGDHLLFWADNDTVDGPMHLNFKLGATGEQIGLYDTDGTTLIDSITFGQQLPDISYGRYPDGSNDWRSMNIPTPGDVNNIGAAGSVDVSEPSRTFTTSLSVTLTATNNADGIRYTLDGSVPTGSSSAYGSPLTITNSTILRARAFKSGMEDGPVVSSHYILLADDEIRTLESELPILLVESFGVDIPLGVDGTDPRQFTYMAIFEPGTNGLTSVTNLPTLSTRAGMEYRGNSTLNLPKKQLRIETWLDDRDEEKDISPFGMSSDGDWMTISGANFDNTLMRPSLIFDLDRQIGNWSPRTIFVEVFINTNGGAMSYSENYMGVSAFGEEINRAAGRVDLARLDPDDTAEPDISGGYMFRDDWFTHFSAGGLDFDWQYPSKETMNSAPYATQKQWLIDYIDEAKSVLDGAGFDDPATGYAKYIDVESFIDYHWFVMLTEDIDGLTKSTYWHKHRGGKLRMGPHWDYDRAMGMGDPRCSDPFSWVRGSTDFFTYGFYDRMFQDVEFWQQWIDRWFELREGTFSTPNVNATINSISDSIGDVAAARNFAKWGGGPRNGGEWETLPDVFNGEWSGEVQYLAAWLEARSSWFDEQFLARPTYNEDGGLIPVWSELVITGPAGATVYYTLDGTDPRAPGGAPSAAALEYTGPVLLSSNVTVVSRAYDSTWPNGAWQGDDAFATTLPWSAPREAVFMVAPHTVAVTEVMYNPRDPELGTAETNYVTSDFEFIEISNIGIVRVDLAGLRFSDGILFDWSHGSVPSLEIGESAIVVNNLAAFTNRYPDWGTIKIAGEYEGSLNDAGESIRLESVTGQAVSVFSYNDSRGWPLSADGAGHSLVATELDDQAAGSLSYGGNWRASTYMDGSPGVANPAPIVDVVINEFAAHTDYTNPAKPEYDSNDWIELYNTKTTEVGLADWYLSDSASDLKKWAIPSIDTIAAEDWKVFDEVTGFHSPITNGFGLSKAGEQLFLSYLPGTDQDRVADCVSFEGQENGASWGRYPDGDANWLTTALTAGTTNALASADVVISQFMYHPAPTVANPEDNTNDEYIVLYNTTDAPIQLWNDDGPWAIDGGVDYTFPSNTTIGAHDYLTVVSFNPTNTAAMAAFEAAYDLPNIMGPYVGTLSNDGERISLVRPQADSTISWVTVDEVIYSSAAPWADASTNGTALHRIEPRHSGNDQLNWTAQPPALARPKVVLTSPQNGSHMLIPFSHTATAVLEEDQLVGNLQHVEFFLNGSSIGTDTSAPFEAVIDHTLVTTTGTYTVYARVVDDEPTNSVASVFTAELAPRVAITSPPNGASFLLPFSTTLAAWIDDEHVVGDATVTFFNGATSLGTVSNAPYEIAVDYTNFPAPGTYPLYAVLTDTFASTTSLVSNIIVADHAARVAITSPADGTSVPPQFNTTLVASVDEAYVLGNATVTFFNGTTSLGSDNSPPYEIALDQDDFPGPGDYSLSAVLDDAFASSTSQVSSLTIESLRGLPFADGFDAGDGYTLWDDLNGKAPSAYGSNTWVASGVVVTNDPFHAGGQAADLTSETAVATQTFNGGQTNVWTDLYIQPVFGDNSSVPPPPGSSCVFSVYTNGQVVAYSGSVQTQLVHAALTEGEWVRFRMHSDYGSKTWDLYLNDDPTPIGSGLGFFDTSAESYTEFGISGAPSNAVVDSIGIIEAASAANLAVTELMYNPAAPTAGEISAGFTSESFFEYIEVMNIGTDTIDLTGVNFVTGITFAFPSLTLLPNERAVVARNEAGFLARNGANGSLVAGEYGGDLSNDGELIILTAANGSVIRSFTYGDAFPWPESPDGLGPSLVLIAPESDPDHDLAANWRPSTMNGGVPGASDASTGFTGDPHADLDGNGQEDFLDYGLAGSSPPMTVVFDPVAGTGTMTFLRNLAADDVLFDFVTSTNMIDWTPGGAIRIASFDNGDGTATETWQAVLPLEVEDTWFIRLKLTGR